MGLDNPLHIAFLVVILLLVFGAKRLPGDRPLARHRHARVQGLGQRRVASRLEPDHAAASSARAAGARSRPHRSVPYRLSRRRRPDRPGAPSPQQAAVSRRASLARRHPRSGRTPQAQQCAERPTRAAASVRGSSRGRERIGGRVQLRGRSAGVQRAAQPCAGSGPLSTASNSEPGTRLICSRSSSFQRGSGAPVMYHGEPLSATISP